MLDENENPDIQVRIEDLDNGGNSVLKRINPSDYRRTLGYNLNATNDNTELTKVLVAKAKKYNEALYRYRLTAAQKQMAITTFITPSLTFPFRGGTLKYEELSAIQKPLGMATCDSHNVHRNVAITSGPVTSCIFPRLF